MIFLKITKLLYKIQVVILQITLHSFVVYYNDGSNVKHDCFAITSEDLKHDANAINLFIQKLILKLKERHNLIRKLIYISDGARSQYKNKYNFINLCYHYNDFKILSEWHFYATLHGKSPCDGIGGTLKRMATRASLQNVNKEFTSTAKQFYEWSLKSIENITAMFCTTVEHNLNEERLRNRFSQACPIKGTRNFHCYIPKSEKEILCKVYSASKDNKKRKLMISINPFKGLIISTMSKH